MADLETVHATIDHTGITGVGGSGSVASDPIWAAKGDIAAGTGDDTAAVLSAGSNGMVPVYASGETTGLKTAYPPGYEFDYVAYSTGNVNVTQTAEASADTLVTANAVTYDGSTTIIIEFWANNARPTTAAAANIIFWLYDGSSSIGQIGQITASGTSGASSIVHGMRRLTPSAAAHTYSIRATVSTGTGLVAAGAGGAGNSSPMFIRQYKV